MARLTGPGKYWDVMPAKCQKGSYTLFINVQGKIHNLKCIDDYIVNGNIVNWLNLETCRFAMVSGTEELLLTFACLRPAEA